MTNDSFDLIVLGAGSGGLAAAKRAASYGARVAIVEGDRVGGTCVIRGCVPKKLLVYGSAYAHLLADAASYGWSVGEIRCDPPTLLRRVRAEVDRLNALHIQFLEKAGVELVRGWGHFTAPTTVAVSPARCDARCDAGGTRWAPRRAICGSCGRSASLWPSAAGPTGPPFLAPTSAG